MRKIKQNASFRRKNDETVVREFHEILELSNQEVYDSFAKLKVEQQQTENQIMQTEQNIENLKKKQDMIEVEISKIEEIARDCEKRIPSKPREVEE